MKVTRRGRIGRMAGLTPQLLMLIALGGTVGAMLVIARWKSAMLVFGVMMLASALAAPVDPLGRAVQTWLTPVQTRRSEIFAAGGALLLIAIVFHIHRLKVHRLQFQAMLLVAVGFYGAFVRAIGGGDLSSGTESAIFAFFTLVPAVIVLPSLINSRDDAIASLRVMALVSAAWAGACAVQFVLRPKILTLGGGYMRFQGMLANPQHAAVFLSFCVVVCSFLMLNDTKARYRPIWASLAGVNLLMTLWTGSRTGAMMTVIGCIAVFYSRLGRSILLLPVGAGVLMGAMSFIQQTKTIDFSRLTSGQDTRSKAWAVLWQEFLDRPMWGTAMAEMTTYSENSILMALAGYGFLMGIIVILFFVVTLFKCLMIYRARFALRDPVEKRLADLVVGMSGMYLAGSLFEGYIVSRVSSPMAFMLLTLGLGAWVQERAKQQQAEDADEAWAPAEGTGPDLSDSRYDEYGDFSHYGEESDAGHGAAASDSRAG